MIIIKRKIKKKMKYPPCNSKVFRNKVKYTIKYKTITNKTSSSHSQPLPALILSLKKTYNMEPIKPNTGKEK